MVFCCSSSAAVFSAILRSKHNVVLITTPLHGFFDGNRRRTLGTKQFAEECHPPRVSCIVLPRLTFHRYVILICRAGHSSEDQHLMTVAPTTKTIAFFFTAPSFGDDNVGWLLNCPQYSRMILQQDSYLPFRRLIHFFRTRDNQNPVVRLSSCSCFSKTRIIDFLIG